MKNNNGEEEYIFPFSYPRSWHPSCILVGEGNESLMGKVSFQFSSKNTLNIRLVFHTIQCILTPHQLYSISKILNHLFLFHKKWRSEQKDNKQTAPINSHPAEAEAIYNITIDSMLEETNNNTPILLESENLEGKCVRVENIGVRIHLMRGEVSVLHNTGRVDDLQFKRRYKELASEQQISQPKFKSEHHIPLSYFHLEMCNLGCNLLVSNWGERVSGAIRLQYLTLFNYIHRSFVNTSSEWSTSSLFYSLLDPKNLISWREPEEGPGIEYFVLNPKSEHFCECIVLEIVGESEMGEVREGGMRGERGMEYQHPFEAYLPNPYELNADIHFPGRNNEGEGKKEKEGNCIGITFSFEKKRDIILRESINMNIFHGDSPHNPPTTFYELTFKLILQGLLFSFSPHNISQLTHILYPLQLIPQNSHISSSNIPQIYKSIVHLHYLSAKYKKELGGKLGGNMLLELIPGKKKGLPFIIKQFGVSLPFIRTKIFIEKSKVLGECSPESDNICNCVDMSKWKGSCREYIEEKQSLYTNITREPRIASTPPDPNSQFLVVDIGNISITMRHTWTEEKWGSHTMRHPLALLCIFTLHTFNIYIFLLSHFHYIMHTENNLFTLLFRNPQINKHLKEYLIRDLIFGKEGELFDFTEQEITDSDYNPFLQGSLNRGTGMSKRAIDSEGFFEPDDSLGVEERSDPSIYNTEFNNYNQGIEEVFENSNIIFGELLKKGKEAASQFISLRVENIVLSFCLLDIPSICKYFTCLDAQSSEVNSLWKEKREVNRVLGYEMRVGNGCIVRGDRGDGGDGGDGDMGIRDVMPSANAMNMEISDEVLEGELGLLGENVPLRKEVSKVTRLSFHKESFEGEVEGEGEVSGGNSIPHIDSGNSNPLGLPSSEGELSQGRGGKKQLKMALLLEVSDITINLLSREVLHRSGTSDPVFGIFAHPPHPPHPPHKDINPFESLEDKTVFLGETMYQSTYKKDIYSTEHMEYNSERPPQHPNRSLPHFGLLFEGGNPLLICKLHNYSHIITYELSISLKHNKRVKEKRVGSAGKVENGYMIDIKLMEDGVIKPYSILFDLSAASKSSEEHNQHNPPRFNEQVDVLNLLKGGSTPEHSQINLQHINHALPDFVQTFTHYSNYVVWFKQSGAKERSVPLFELATNYILTSDYKLINKVYDGAYMQNLDFTEFAEPPYGHQLDHQTLEGAGEKVKIHSLRLGVTGVVLRAESLRLYEDIHAQLAILGERKVQGVPENPKSPGKMERIRYIEVNVGEVSLDYYPKLTIPQINSVFGVKDEKKGEASGSQQYRSKLRIMGILKQGQLSCLLFPTRRKLSEVRRIKEERISGRISELSMYLQENNRGLGKYNPVLLLDPKTPKPQNP